MRHGSKFNSNSKRIYTISAMFQLASFNLLMMGLSTFYVSTQQDCLLDLQEWILQSNYSDPTIQQGVTTFSNSQLYDRIKYSRMQFFLLQNMFFKLRSRKEEQRKNDKMLEFRFRFSDLFLTSYVNDVRLNSNFYPANIFLYSSIYSKVNWS